MGSTRACRSLSSPEPAELWLSSKMFAQVPGRGRGGLPERSPGANISELPSRIAKYALFGKRSYHDESPPKARNLQKRPSEVLLTNGRVSLESNFLRFHGTCYPLCDPYAARDCISP
jgi:hypothetical protein